MKKDTSLSQQELAGPSSADVPHGGRSPRSRKCRTSKDLQVPDSPDQLDREQLTKLRQLYRLKREEAEYKIKQAKLQQLQRQLVSRDLLSERLQRTAQLLSSLLDRIEPLIPESDRDRYLRLCADTREQIERIFQEV